MNPLLEGAALPLASGDEPRSGGGGPAGLVALPDPRLGANRTAGGSDTEPRLRGDERLAVITVAAGTAFLPFLKPGGPSNLAPVDLLILVGVIASILWAATTRQRLRLPYLLPIGLLLVGGGIGAIIGPVSATSAVSLVQDLWLAAWCWACFNVSRSARNLRVILSAWVYGAFAWGGVLMVGIITSQPLLTGVNARDGSRVQLTLGDPSYAANYFFISIMIMWATQRPRKRWARYLAYAIFVVAMAFTGSNSGVVSLAVGILVAGVVGVWRRAGIAPAVATLALLLASGVLIAKNVSLAQIQTEAQGSKISFIRDGLGRGTSVNQRGMLLGESLKLYTDGSVFGEGPASTKVRLIDSGAQFAKQAHDDYLGALTERGFIGFAGVLLLAVTVFLRAAGAAVSRLRDGYAAVLARPNALLGAVLGTLVAATVYGLFHNRHVWTLFAIAAAASFWGRGHK